MTRYRLTIEYDGRPYVGWQRQSNGTGIQQILEQAIFAFSGERVNVHGAGRTDAGVHATGQVAHIDLTTQRRADVVRDAMNAHMRRHPIAVLKAVIVDDDFDARFSALRRHYVYRICNRPAPLAVGLGFAWHMRRALDARAMHEAAQCLLGKHDFSTFRDAECQANSPLRTLDQFDVRREGDEIIMRVSAQSFLHRQVRSMVGSLEHVGSGKWSRDDLWQALQARDRAHCGQVAPSHGLYLARVDYE
jgi:tRNA pseudouridine38-40 synthase